MEKLSKDGALTLTKLPSGSDAELKQTSARRGFDLVSRCRISVGKTVGLPSLKPNKSFLLILALFLFLPVSQPAHCFCWSLTGKTSLFKETESSTGTANMPGLENRGIMNMAR
jgi:hypothetical protein